MQGTAKVLYIHNAFLSLLNLYLGICSDLVCELLITEREKSWCSIYIAQPWK